MRELLYYIFLISCSFFFISGLIKPIRIYQFPFLFAVTCIIIIIPTATVIMDNSNELSDSAYIIFFINAILCFWGGILGYLMTKINVNKLNKTKYIYNENKLFQYNLPFYLISQFFAWYLYFIGGFSAFDNPSVFVYMVFLARFNRTSSIIALVDYLKSPKFYKLLIVISCFILPFINIIYQGRRSDVIYFSLSILLPLFFIKKWIPTRLYIIPAMVIVFILIIVLPIYRNYSVNKDFKGAFNINVDEIVSNYFKLENTNELLEACYNIESVYEAGVYSYGSGFYNSFIEQYVPRGIVGAEFKDRLFIKADLDMYQIRDKYGENKEFKSYLANTGFAVAFYEFGFFSFFIFLILGIYSKILFFKAYYTRDLYYIIYYSLFSILITFGIVYDIQSMLVVLLPTYLISKFVTNKSRIRITNKP